MKNLLVMSHECSNICSLELCKMHLLFILDSFGNHLFRIHFFYILKVSPDQFHHLLKGLKSGCPPHGGIALGKRHVQEM